MLNWPKLLLQIGYSLHNSYSVSLKNLYFWNPIPTTHPIQTNGQSDKCPPGHLSPGQLSRGHLSNRASLSGPIFEPLGTNNRYKVNICTGQLNYCDFKWDLATTKRKICLQGLSYFCFLGHPLFDVTREMMYIGLKFDKVRFQIFDKASI